MSKKDFIALADHIKANLSTFTPEAVQSLADHMQSTYPAFKATRWIGYIYGNNGSNGGPIRK